MEKSVVKYQDKLIEKIKKHFKVNEDISKKECKSLVLREFNKIRNICKSENIGFVCGQGRRKTEEQREYELLEVWLEKLNRYEKWPIKACLQYSMCNEWRIFNKNIRIF